MDVKSPVKNVTDALPQLKSCESPNSIRSAKKRNRKLTLSLPSIHFN